MAEWWKYHGYPNGENTAEVMQQVEVQTGRVPLFVAMAMGKSVEEHDIVYHIIAREVQQALSGVLVQAPEQSKTR